MPLLFSQSWNNHQASKPTGLPTSCKTKLKEYRYDDDEFQIRVL
jgi:hypothetical protein